MALSKGSEVVGSLYLNWSAPKPVAADLETGRGYAAGERDALENSCRAAMAREAGERKQQMAAMGNAICLCFANLSGGMMSRFDRRKINALLEKDKSSDAVSRQSLRNFGLSDERVVEIMDRSEQRLALLTRQCAASVGYSPANR